MYLSSFTVLLVLPLVKCTLLAQDLERNSGGFVLPRFIDLAGRRFERLGPFARRLGYTAMAGCSGALTVIAATKSSCAAQGCEAAASNLAAVSDRRSFWPTISNAAAPGERLDRIWRYMKARCGKPFGEPLRSTPRLALRHLGTQ